MQRLSAKAVDPTRPKYLIVFDDSSTKNTSTLSSVLKRKKAPGVKERDGMAMLSAGDTGVNVKVFESLGVAAADLSKGEHDALCKRSDVVAVVENEIRSLPPVRRTLEETDKAETNGGGNSQIIAYLEGLRDAANLALAYQQGRKPIAMSTFSARPAASLAAAGKTTWGLNAIGVGTALNAPTGKKIKVAVLDTGIDLDHPDIGNKVSEGTTAVSMVKNVSVQDVNGHGTHCAGVIAGPRQSVSGFRYGVAPDVELLIGKVFNNKVEPKASDDDILEGITWAEQKGARIISMSLGDERKVGEKFPIAYETIVKKLLNRKSGSVLLVAAAGNESGRPDFTAPVCSPASCPSIMAVAAIDRHKRVAEFSCAQMDAIGIVDVCAPGVAIFSSTTNGTFEKLDGTSMATPFVAGLAALYLEKNPKMTARKLFDELKSRARKTGTVEDLGAGLVQL